MIVILFLITATFSAAQARCPGVGLLKYLQPREIREFPQNVTAFENKKDEYAGYLERGEKLPQNPESFSDRLALWEAIQKVRGINTRSLVTSTGLREDVSGRKLRRALKALDFDKKIHRDQLRAAAADILAAQRPEGTYPLLSYRQLIWEGPRASVRAFMKEHAEKELAAKEITEGFKTLDLLRQDRNLMEGWSHFLSHPAVEATYKSVFALLFDVPAVMEGVVPPYVPRTTALQRHQLSEDVLKELKTKGFRDAFVLLANHKRPDGKWTVEQKAKFDVTVAYVSKVFLTVSLVYFAKFLKNQWDRAAEEREEGRKRFEAIRKMLEDMAKEPVDPLAERKRLFEMWREHYKKNHGDYPDPDSDDYKKAHRILLEGQEVSPEKSEEIDKTDP